jgi:SAM-dependent methyltransferase
VRTVESGPRRSLRNVGRALLWPFRRFFDPRFEGIAHQINVKHEDVLAKHGDILAEVLAVRSESRQRHAESIDLARALADLVRETDRWRQAMRTGSVDDIDEEVARLLNYAGTHEGFAAQRGLWFNPPLALRYSAGDVVLEETIERIVEVPYVLRALAHVEAGATVLDVGATESLLAISLASLGYDVTALDPRPYPFDHPSLRTVVASIQDWDHEGVFDAVVCLSTVEHIGLGAYGEAPAAEGSDLAAMKRMRELTKPGGLFVLTVPVGKADANEFQRTYDAAGLDALLEGWKVEDLTITRRKDRRTWVVEKDGFQSTRPDSRVALVTARRV